MSELNQLKERTIKAGPEGIPTAIIRDDYEPAGDLMIRNLLDSGEFISARICTGTFSSEWKLFAKEFEWAATSYRP